MDKLICYNHSSFYTPKLFFTNPFHHLPNYVHRQIQQMTSRWNMERQDSLNATLVTGVQNYRFGFVVIVVCGVCSFFAYLFHVDRIFVSTWNVAGKSPPNCLNLEDWLHASPPVDIYVLGYLLILYMQSLSGYVWLQKFGNSKGEA